LLGEDRGSSVRDSSDSSAATRTSVAIVAGNRLAKFARTAEAKKTLPTEGDWEWGGCGDNVNFGFKKSRDFMDAPYRKRSDIKTLVKLHNNDAGRLVSNSRRSRYARRACLTRTRFCKSIAFVKAPMSESVLDEITRIYAIMHAVRTRFCFLQLPLQLVSRFEILERVSLNSLVPLHVASCQSLPRQIRSRSYRIAESPELSDGPRFKRQSDTLHSLLRPYATS